MACFSSTLLLTFKQTKVTSFSSPVHSFPSESSWPRLSPFTFSIFSVRINKKLNAIITKSQRSSQERPKKKTSLLSFEKQVKRLVVATDQSLLATIFHAFDGIINNFIDPPTRVSIDPRNLLYNNFLPVDELPPTDCEVIEGTLPSCLDGAYIRNGPNPQFLPQGPYHRFDGDGMLHAIRISQGKATLCSRYVKTYKYNMEKDAGFPIIPSLFSGFNGMSASMARTIIATCRVLTGQLDPFNGTGMANTSLVFFGNKLYALWETDFPYAIKLESDGDITTIGRQDFDGKLVMSMTAHPKIDPVTKETFAYRYGMLPPFVTFFWFNENGEKEADVPILSMKSPCLVHDFAITKNYAIFPETQIGMSAMNIINGGSPMCVDPRKVSRLGVILRYAKDESDMKWFEVPGFNIVHAINAWEEDGGTTLVLVAPNILSVENTFKKTDLLYSTIEKVRINLNTGLVSRHPLSTRNLDFCVINPNFVATKNRYIYCAAGDPMPKISGVVKLDVSLSEADKQECIVASRMFGPNCFGGEPFFVAREPDNPHADEDDGYIVSYVHNENTNESRFLVMDAKSPTLEIVAAVKLPQRVPYGFHGLFLRESDINKL